MSNITNFKNFNLTNTSWVKICPKDEAQPILSLQFRKIEIMQNFNAIHFASNLENTSTLNSFQPMYGHMSAMYYH
jgi:hypothetical protein